MKKKIISFLLKSRKVYYYNKKNKIHLKVQKSPDFKVLNFGKKNNRKFFYVIKRIKGGGLFSNLLFVLNHLIIAEKLKFIPVIDMENFTNLYNEKIKVYGTYNSWLYYFEPVSKYTLNEVYKSKNVIFSTENIFDGQSLSYKENKKNIIKVFKKYIKIKHKYVREANNFIKKNKINLNTLGVHWRGTDHKVLPNHPMPPTKNQILRSIKEFRSKKKFNNIFLITEQKKYLKFLKLKFDNLIFYNSFRSNNLTDFSLYNRKLHKYNLGKESLIEALILSKVKYLICSRSNISEFAELISKKKMCINEIDNGYNNKSIFLSLFKWHVKNFLPKIFGGFN